MPEPSLWLDSRNTVLSRKLSLFYFQFGLSLARDNGGKCANDVATSPLLDNIGQEPCHCCRGKWRQKRERALPGAKYLTIPVL